MISVLGELELPRLTELDLPRPLGTYLDIRQQHGQVLNYIAVLENLKPCLDDWIPASRYAEFQALCDDAGLHVRSGIQFDAISHAEAEDVIGAGTLTTTRARAVPMHTDRGSVHVFVGRDASAVDRTFTAGWYPLVVGDRATSKPWIDHIWFGEGLGYPPCCLRAFARHNNWSINNMPYQAIRGTTAPNALCNSLMRFTGLTWAPHLPCSYDCAATSAQSARLRDAVRTWSYPLADLVDRLVTGRHLVLSEWEAFVLHRSAWDGPVLRYGGASLVPTNRPNTRLFEALGDGDELEVRDEFVIVRGGGDVRFVEECRTDGFSPRIPMIIDFPAPGSSGG